MLVNELKAILDKYDKETVKEIAVLLYRKIPKSRREYDSLDELLTNYAKDKTKASAPKQVGNFTALKAEVELFLQHADKQYYYIPNTIIRKDQRPKWRFMVKRFVKELLANKEDSEAASDLLINIYDMLSYACNYYIFSTPDPFASIGYCQYDFLRVVLEKILSCGYTRANRTKANKFAPRN